MSSLEKTFIKSNPAKLQKLSKQAETRREIFAKEKSKVDFRTVSKTFTITRRENQFFLQTNEIKLSDRFSVKAGTSYLNQYFQTIKSLSYNYNFILNAQNFKDFDIDDNGNVVLVDLDGNIKSVAFEYSQKILAGYVCTSIYDQVKDNITKTFIEILESYEKILNDLKPYVENEKKSALDQTELFDKVEGFKNQTLASSQNMITALKNKKINLSEFLDNLSYEDIASVTL